MTFALITEGVSEHRIIKHILEKFFKDHSPNINQIQPKLLNEKQDTPGGWNEVLKYCEREELGAALIYNDYLVIQIDTDQSETDPFSISHTKGGSISKTNEELYTEVVDKLQGLIQPDIKKKYPNRIFFAICIHTIECWLLPMYYNDKRKSATLTCLGKLNSELRRKNMDTIPRERKNEFEGIRGYEAALKPWKRKTDIEASAKFNVGFQQFVESLKTIQ